MTLRASMLVPLIYDAPNLRRVTYIVSTAFVSLYKLLVPERRETRDRPRDLMACTALVLLPIDLAWTEESGVAVRGLKTIEFLLSKIFQRDHRIFIERLLKKKKKNSTSFS